MNQPAGFRSSYVPGIVRRVEDDSEEEITVATSDPPSALLTQSLRGYPRASSSYHQQHRAHIHYGTPVDSSEQTNSTLMPTALPVSTPSSEQNAAIACTVEKPPLQNRSMEVTRTQSGQQPNTDIGPVSQVDSLASSIYLRKARLFPRSDNQLCFSYLPYNVLLRSTEQVLAPTFDNEVPLEDLLPSNSAREGHSRHHHCSSNITGLRSNLRQPDTQRHRNPKPYCGTLKYNSPSATHQYDRPDESALTKKVQRAHRRDKHKWRAAAAKKGCPRANFMTLSGEIRNHIYSYLIPSTRILVCKNSPQKEHAQLKKCWSTSNQKPATRRVRLHHLREPNTRRIRRGMLFVCHELHNEVKLHLYSHTTFCFSSATNINLFLNIASKLGVQAIERIEILHEGYGNPELACDQRWQQKYNQTWEATFDRVGKEMTGLKSLYLETTLTHWPFDVSTGSIDACLKQTYLKLAPRLLDSVRVKMAHKMFEKNFWLMEDIARNLEDEMMSSEGRDCRDRAQTLFVERQLQKKRDERRHRMTEGQQSVDMATPSQAKRAIIIRLKDISQAATNPRIDGIVRKTGLEGYSRLEQPKEP